MHAASLKEFSDVARRFIDWVDVEGAPPTAPDALRHLSDLYVAALALPNPWSPGLPEGDTEPAVPEQARRHAAVRASQLPIDAYWLVFDPLTNQPEAPVCGTLSDDISDVYSDVWRGLRLYDDARHAEALWEWGFNFRIHWGKHALSAMCALHEHLSQEQPDGLSSDV